MKFSSNDHLDIYGYILDISIGNLNQHPGNQPAGGLNQSFLQIIQSYLKNQEKSIQL